MLKATFWYHSNDTTRNPWVMAVYTLPFTFQLCYKPLGILQRITKSQKVHISSHDVLQKSHTSEEGGSHLRISFWHLLMNFENQKNQNFEKMEKKEMLEILLFYICVPKTTIRCSYWDTELHTFFCQLRPFFALYPPPPTF